jgi:DNA mismatch repair protein MutS
LTDLAASLPDVANVHVAALERSGWVVFLYAVRPGPADRAYGIQVARLAGLPPWVADRAEALLTAMPRDERLPTPRPRRIAEDGEGDEDVEDVDDPEVHPEPSDAVQFAAALRVLDLNEITPRQALEWLWAQQDRLSERPDQA